MTNQPKLEKLDAIKNPYNLNNVARRNTQTIYFVNGKHIHVGDADTVYWAWLEGAEAQLSACEKVVKELLKQERENTAREIFSKGKLIKPDGDSLSQFEPFYAIPESVKSQYLGGK